MLRGDMGLHQLHNAHYVRNKNPSEVLLCDDITLRVRLAIS